MRSIRRLTLALSAAALIAGCAQTPEERSLAAHVYYLASPEMKGRAPGSAEGRRAAEYIEARFRECGLKPLPGAEGFFQAVPIGNGRNVVGVLAGSDPALADEMVLLIAHYDHLGEVGGKTYPGAADNASGCATILEMARTLQTLISSGRIPRP